jgi:hypothetical protein
MNSKAFHFEIHDLLNQFVAAYDDVVISRYNKDREEKSKIKVRYVHAPKQRLFYDLENKSQNLTLPVIAVNVTSVARDESRVFNKITGMFLPTKYDDKYSKTTQIRMPVPVNLGISMSIIANYQTDIEQIISNFIPYTNPYIIICWKIPEDFNLDYISEIRTEVLWDGNISLVEPLEPAANDKARFSADATFTIKGWLFPANPHEPFSNIHVVNNNFNTTSNLLLNLDEYNNLKKNSYKYDARYHLLSEIEYAPVSGAPEVTNLYNLNYNKFRELSGNIDIFGNDTTIHDYAIYGRRFDSTTSILISSSSAIDTKTLTSFSFAHYPSISGYIVDKNDINVVNENILNFTMSGFNVNTNINFLFYNLIYYINKINSYIN